LLLWLLASPEGAAAVDGWPRRKVLLLLTAVDGWTRATRRNATAQVKKRTEFSPIRIYLIILII
jgi:hypothetical protein